MSDLFIGTPNNGVAFPKSLGNTNTFIFSPANDLQIDANGNLTTVSGTTKLQQDIIKILLTVRGTNLNNPSYGSLLSTFLGQKIDPAYLRGQVKAEVVDCLRLLQSINSSNSNLDEQIKTLQSITTDMTTPTQLSVSFTVITMSDKTVDIEASITTG